MQIQNGPYDYNAPEVELWAGYLQDAVYDMNRDMPNHRQVAFIPSNAAQAAKGILDVLREHTKFVLPVGGKIYLSHFPDDFSVEDAIREGMYNENQSWLCDEWPEFMGYLIARCTGQMGDEQILFYD